MWEENRLLTQEIRSGLKGRELLPKEDTACTVHESFKWTEQQRGHWRNYQPGHLVTFTKSVGGKAGDSATDAMTTTLVSGGSTNSTPTFANPQKLDTLVPGNGTANPPWSGITAASINDNGAIVGTATYQPPAVNGALPPTEQHGVMLIPCQFSLLNGNQSGTDGLNFDGTRPQTVTATSPDNTTAALDIQAMNGGTQTNIDVLGTVTPIGLGRRDLPGACYTASLILAAKVMPATATNVSYSWNRTYNRHAVLIQWNGISRWNVNQVNYQTALPDDQYTDYQTDIPSPESLLYIWDNPAMDLIDNFDTAQIGDYAYLEYDFTYNLTIIIGSATTTRTIDVGQTILAKRVNKTGNVATDWQGLENIVSTTNIPNCQINFTKVHAIVGYLPFPSLQINIPTNINTPTQ